MREEDQESEIELNLGSGMYGSKGDESQDRLFPSGMSSAIDSANRQKETLSDRQRKRVLRIFIGIVTFIFFVIIVLYLATRDAVVPDREASAAAHTGFVYDSGFNMQHNWGAYSPYFDSGSPFDSVSKSALDGEFTLPNTCRFKQVHLLHRHGNRSPAGKTALGMKDVAQKLQNMSEPPALESLQWIQDWEYLLSEDLLVGSGVGKLFESGVKFWTSHGRFLYGNASLRLLAWDDDINVYPNGTKRPKPLVRSTTQSRMQDSARAWSAGFFGTYGFPSTGVDPTDHYELLLMEETTGSNNSLSGYLACPNIEAPHAQNGKERSKKWVQRYLAAAAKRIQKVLPGYDNVTPEEVLSLQDLCVFETASFGQSAFCGLFTEQEWRGYEYHLDLKFYGDNAWGSEVGPATGLSWLSELRARLVKEYITKPQFGVNVTLDNNSVTFPLDQPFYADFTHDNVIVTVLSALQFQFTKPDLSPKKIKVPRQFIVSRLTPFASHLYVEILECGPKNKEYVRLVLNGRVLPIGDLHYCRDDEDGLCPLSDFIKSIEHSLDKIDYDSLCFGDHKFETYEED